MHTPPLLPSVYALLSQIIDYAGLFPPANLTLIEAIRNFIHYRTLPEQWMLSRFILPAHRIGDLSRLIDNGLTWEGTLSFSILGQGGADRTAFLTGLDADVQAVSTFRAQYGGRVRADVYETRVPASEVGEDDRARILLGEALPRLAGAGLVPFLETPFGIGWEARAGVLIRALSQVPAAPRAGFKLRTGGVTADAFPSPKQISLALRLCEAQGVPLKCTAGLHHPVRSFREEVGTNMHGFLNVFVAGVLRQLVHHPGARPKPFMRPAFDSKAQAALEATGEYLRKRFFKEMTYLNRKCIHHLKKIIYFIPINYFKIYHKYF